MSTEQLFRKLLEGDEPTAIMPNVNLRELADTLDASGLGRLTVDFLQLKLQSKDATELQKRASEALWQRIQSQKKLYDPATANHVLQLLTELAKVQLSAPDSVDHKNIYTWKIRLAMDVLLGLQGGITNELKKSLVLFVALQTDHNTQTFALSAVAGKSLSPSAPVNILTGSGNEIVSDNSMFVSEQLEIINALATTKPTLCLNISKRMDEWNDAMDDDKVDPPGFLIFARAPGFVEKSRPAIQKATEHLEKIHTGDLPFKADKAFSKPDALALARFVNVALDNDESWLPPLLDSLLEKLSIAPTAAKTAPSQSAAIAIAKAIAERPTISAWLSLKAVSTNTRHAGLKKKLEKLCKKAEQRLSTHKDFLRQWPAEMAVPRRLNAGIKRAFEQVLISGEGFSSKEFNSLLSAKGLAPVAVTLIWVAKNANGCQTSFRLIKRKNAFQFLNSHGEELIIDKQTTLRLLHPLESAEEELEHWRSWLLATKTKQPFNQLFRETYRFDASAIDKNVSNHFADYTLAAATLIGLSTAVGWHLSKYEGFKMKLEPYLIVFNCGELYPGYRGNVDSGSLSVFKGSEPVNWNQLPALCFSEAYRAADLLVSVAAFAADDEPCDTFEIESTADLLLPSNTGQPGYTTARNRIDLLRRFYPGEKDSNQPYVDGRYLCVDDVRIHCATGRASRSGETIELQTIKSADQLPYPDPVLERIIAAVNSILSSQH